MKRVTTTIVGVLVGFALLAARGVAFADDISGTITTTWTIYEDSRLVGHVMCTVTGAPCIQFGAPGITLKLNGFTMTGQADVKTGCAGGRVALENGISTNGQNDVAILGPGLVQAFRANGILASGGSSGMRVARVTAANNCQSGILVSGGASDGMFERNVLVRNFGSKVPGFSWGGICLAGSSKRNLVRRNELGGNGYVNPDDDFGIGIASGFDNVVEENHGVGNTNGIILFPGVTGNIVRRNLFVGNPPAQVSDSFPTHNGVDIDNRAAPDANTIQNNQCVTSRNAPCTIPVSPSGKGKKTGK